MAPHPTAPLLVAALLCAAAAAARGTTIKVTANKCEDFADAFKELNFAYSTATSSAPITLLLTLSCNGSFVCTNQDTEKAIFESDYASTSDLKQPIVRIVIAPEARCRSGDSRPVINGSAYDGNELIYITPLYHPRTRMHLSISSIRAVGFNGGDYGWFVSYNPWSNTGSTFTSKDVDYVNSKAYIATPDTVMFTGGLVSNVPSPPISFIHVMKSVTVQGVTFRDNGLERSKYQPRVGSIYAYFISANAKVTITGNTFQNNVGDFNAKAVFLSFNGDVSAKLTRNTFANNTGGLAPAVVCVCNTKTAVRTTLSVAGSKGLDPAGPSSNKSAPWPINDDCNVAAFLQA